MFDVETWHIPHRTFDDIEAQTTDKYITWASFENVPANCPEICDYLNWLIDRATGRIDDPTDYVWKAYWNGTLQNAPAPIFDDGYVY